MPEDQWQTQDRPELRIVTDDLWERVQARRRQTDVILNGQRQAGRPLLRGRCAQLHSTALFSGFMTCGVCGKAINVVGSHLVNGVLYRYYGCAQASRNGATVCPNNIKVRLETADRMLLAGLQAELLCPETADYIVRRLAAELNELVDQRPQRREELERAKTAAEQKLKNLVAAVEAGAGTATLFQAIESRENELRSLAGQLAALNEPLEQRLAVVPTWVAQQLRDAAGLLSEIPDRAKAEFQRLGIRFELHPVYGEQDRPFLRAVGSGMFEDLAFSQYSALPTTGSSPRQSGP